MSMECQKKWNNTTSRFFRIQYEDSLFGPTNTTIPNTHPNTLNLQQNKIEKSG